MKMLASIKNVNEAEAVLMAGVEMIDLKQPAAGALGALSPAEIQQIVQYVAGRACTSATIGDLPMQPSQLSQAVESVAAVGVDIVKVGFFGHTSHAECIEALVPIIDRGVRLVAVLFADEKPNFQLLSNLATAGFYGVMLDTAGKDGRSLRDHLSITSLAEFVNISRQHHLFCGLAGALRLSDIQPLTKISPDFIGFRSALVKSRVRTDVIDEAVVLTVRQVLLHCNNLPSSLPSSGTLNKVDCNQKPEWV